MVRTERIVAVMINSRSVKPRAGFALGPEWDFEIAIALLTQLRG
jgi:hypothetical protein